MKKQTRALLYTVITVVLFAGLVTGISYAAYDAGVITNGGENSIGNRTVFTSTPIDALTLNMTTLDKNNNFVKDEEVKISISSLYTDKTICSYDLIWRWNQSYDMYRKSNNLDKEFTIKGISDNSSFEETQIDDYITFSATQTLFSGSIETNPSEVAYQDWHITYTFYKEGYKSDYHQNKTYNGSLSIENVICHA